MINHGTSETRNSSRGHTTSLPARVRPPWLRGDDSDANGFRSRRVAISKAVAISPAMAWRRLRISTPHSRMRVRSPTWMQAHRGRRPVAWWPLDDGARHDRAGGRARADQFRWRPQADRCNGWEASLVEAFADYGKAGRYRSLWFLRRQRFLLARRRRSTKCMPRMSLPGQGRMVAFGSISGRFARDILAAGRAGDLAAEVEKFLIELGLPVGQLPASGTDPDSPRLAAAGKVPFAESERCRRRQSLSTLITRAPLLLPAMGAAVTLGRRRSENARSTSVAPRPKEVCKLYAIDDEITWRNEATN